MLNDDILVLLISLFFRTQISKKLAKQQKESNIPVH